MRLLLNASAALSNVRYMIEHRDEFEDVQQRAGSQIWLALTMLEQLQPLLGDDEHGEAMIASELKLCHASPTGPHAVGATPRRPSREHPGRIGSRGPRICV